jgi:hypothetical protein
MVVPRVIHAMAVKRAKLVAELAHHEARSEYCRKGIATMDAALLLWKEGIHAPKLKRRFKCEPTIVPNLTRQVMTILRQASEPITTGQVVEAIAMGLNLDPVRRRKLTQNIGWRLRDKRHQGIIVQIPGLDGGRLRWVIAEIDDSETEE